MKKFISKKYFSIKILPNFINGEFVEVKTNKYYDITNPATGELLSRVPETSKLDFDNTVNIAKTAYKSWRNIPLITRQRYLFDYVRLLKQNQVIIKINFY